MSGDWQLHTGHKGLQSWVWREEWQVCVREDILAMKRRFKVYEFNREVARFETLKQAQIETLRRLIELAPEDL
jgi:hypothetical protein